jgi:choice-of-anchor B domain-containing protein
MRRLSFLMVLFYLFNSCSKKDNDIVISITDNLSEPTQNIDDDKIIEGKSYCENGFAGIYPCKGYDLLSRIPLEYFESVEGNDSWGWTDSFDGKEYALMGLDDGTAFVDISDPEVPLYLGKLPSATVNSSWRDIKVYEDYAFIVSEAPGHGLQVFDLSKLRSVKTQQTFDSDLNFNEFGNAHNIAINKESGFAYVLGSKLFDGGPAFIDINSPLNPSIVGGYSFSSYTHDAQVVKYHGPDTRFKEKEILFGSNSIGGENNQLIILDVTDKKNPELISSIEYSNAGYTHQGWISDDHKYFFLGDELDELKIGHRTKTRVFDIQNLENPIIHNTYYGQTASIDHNLYVKGSKIYMANYTSGMRVVDFNNISDNDFREEGYFDTYPSDNSTNFFGAWNVYPFFSSGVILISDINSGLFIVKPSNDL